MDKSLLHKYLRGELNDHEQQLMNEFLRREDAQQQLEQALANDWETFKPGEISDEQIGYWRKQFFSRLNKPRKVHRLLRLPYAAIWIAVVLSAGLWLTTGHYRGHTAVMTARMTKTTNPNGRMSVITLSDSSIVYLAGGSTLTYPESFNAGSREISLTGEAFFDVSQHPSQPFIVHTGAVQTRVLGTSFRVSALEARPLSVAVATGKVQVEEITAKALAVLTPGQCMRLAGGQTVISEVNTDDLNAWKDGRLVFNGASLEEVMTTLERWYGIHAVYQTKQPGDRRFTITLSAKRPFNEIMAVLAATGRFTYQLDGNRIVIH